MTNYADLDWSTLNFVRNHLYRRLVNPLNSALGRLMIVQHITQDVVSSVQAQEQFQRVTEGLEVTLNLVKAWAALIHVQSGQSIDDEQRRTISGSDLPAWLVAYLDARTAFQATFQHPVLIHPETFYEALVLLCEVAGQVGSMKTLILRDASRPAGSVWVRAIFEMPARGPYKNLDELVTRLDQYGPTQRDTVTQVHVLRAMLAINGAELRLQNNTESGEQALAVCLAAAPPTEVAPALPRVDLTTPPAQDPPDSLSALARRVLGPPLPGTETGTETGAESGPDRAASEQTAPASSGADAPSGDEDRFETRIVPPPNFAERIKGAGNHKPAAPDDAPTNSAPAGDDDRFGTRIVPPPNFADRIKGAIQPPSEAEAARSEDSASSAGDEQESGADAADSTNPPDAGDAPNNHNGGAPASH